MEKYRYWWFILYPESAPSNWLDILSETCVSLCISPLHDLDIDSDGNLKKPHYHVLICYDGPTTFNNIKKHFTDVLGQPIPKYVLSPSGAFAYLAHLNNPEKHLYDINDVQYLNGCNSTMFANEYSRCMYYDVIENIINDNKCTTIKSALNIVKSCNDYEMLAFFRKNIFYFRTLIKD